MEEEKKDIGVLREMREKLSNLAKDRLKLFSSQDKNEKALQRWEKRAERQREKAILKHENNLRKEFRKVKASEPRYTPYGIDPSHRSESSPPLPPPQDQQEQPYGNWMRSDGHGTLLEDWGPGGRRLEEDFLDDRPRNVQRLYGKRW